MLEAWQRDPDGWRLRIRPGVRFHDGTSVTARELAPQVAAALRESSAGLVTSVRAEGELTLLVQVKGPYAFLLEDLAFIQPQKVVGEGVFGTGPYVVVEESPERLRFKAFREHYRGRPSIDEIEVKLYPDQRNAWSALMRGDLDVLYEVSRESIEFARSESSISVTTFTRPYVYLLGLNVNHEALSNQLVRQALNQAVDRETLIKVAMNGEGEPAQGHIWPRHWAFDSTSPAPQYNPREATRLLERAGLTLRHETGRMPARLRLRCLVYEPLHKMGLVLQRQLAEIDVELQLVIPPTRQMLAQLRAGDFDTFVFEIASARLLKMPYMSWHSSASLLPHGYSGADEVLQRMHDASDEAAVKAATSAFQRTMHDDPPAVFLAWGRISRAVSRRFETPPTVEDVYHSVPRWKPVSN